MRTFVLRRLEDVSGVSGLGVVAEGVEWTCGKVSLCWLGNYQSTEQADSLHVIEATHGHGGKTLIEWVS